MSIETRLLNFKTADRETLHGLLFTPRERKSDLALLLVHGVAMNFYLPPLATFGQALAERRYHCFVINTRGHDWISRAGNLTKFGGAAYETFEDSAKDFDGALDRLSAEGYKRFVLVGHSLGCVKSLLYQGARRRSDVVGVISCSCPRQFYSARAEEQPEFEQLMAQAEEMVAQGKGEEFDPGMDEWRDGHIQRAHLRRQIRQARNQRCASARRPPGLSAPGDRRRRRASVFSALRQRVGASRRSNGNI
jgi:pimeloyl-ACP methyl ester carboxylesterase